MRIDNYITDEAVLSELGARLERTRLQRNLTQRELAEQAGVERRVLQRLEAGESVRLPSLIRVLRALGMLDVLERLIPEPLPSPIELLKLHGRERRRASGRRAAGAHATDQQPDADAQATPAWRWGDENEAPDGARPG